MVCGEQSAHGNRLVDALESLAVEVGIQLHLLCCLGGFANLGHFAHGFKGVFAGGCFWGVSAVFDHVVGVKTVTAGYAGGMALDATYDRVITETTNHAESVRIVYDPAKVSYGRLLQIYFAVAHDPTQLNRQFPDVGRSYRSAIFPQSPAQQQLATAYIAQLNATKAFRRPVVTRLERGTFYPAEAYHQNYLARNPGSAYIQTYDMPKLRALQVLYPQFYK